MVFEMVFEIVFKMVFEAGWEKPGDQLVPGLFA